MLSYRTVIFLSIIIQEATAGWSCPDLSLCHYQRRRNDTFRSRHVEEQNKRIPIDDDRTFFAYFRFLLAIQLMTYFVFGWSLYARMFCDRQFQKKDDIHHIAQIYRNKNIEKPIRKRKSSESVATILPSSKERMFPSKSVLRSRSKVSTDKKTMKQEDIKTRLYNSNDKETEKNVQKVSQLSSRRLPRAPKGHRFEEIDNQEKFFEDMDGASSG